ncbi:MAG: hypothetical protein P8P70_00005 [Sulfitobacter sp.]|nr:hypothetical protein [Sulfitobacter sp.]
MPITNPFLTKLVGSATSAENTVNAEPQSADLDVKNIVCEAKSMRPN